MTQELQIIRVYNPDTEQQVKALQILLGASEQTGNGRNVGAAPEDSEPSHQTPPASGHLPKTIGDEFRDICPRESLFWKCFSPVMSVKAGWPNVSNETICGAVAAALDSAEAPGELIYLDQALVEQTLSGQSLLSTKLHSGIKLRSGTKPMTVRSAMPPDTHLLLTKQFILSRSVCG